MKPLKKKFEAIVSQYIKAFEKKHGYEFSYWVADDIGTIACFIEQYFFNFDDIRKDIDNDVPKELIIEWQDDALEEHYKAEKKKRPAQQPNFESWLLIEKGINIRKREPYGFS